MLIPRLMLLALAASRAPSGPPASFRGGEGDGDGHARIQVWTEGGTTPYQAGARVHVHIRAEDDGYVTVLRVDTDGRVQVLFPRQPWIDNYVRGGQEYEIEKARSSNAFDIDDDPGVGYVFAVSAPDPFTFDAFVQGDRWDYRGVSDRRDGRIHGDPYVALTDLAARMLPAGDRDWDYDIAPYYVDHHVDYPRFLCYDCHASTGLTAWDPYAATCPRFRIVAYDDPSYYSYHYYRGAGVVISRPLHPEARYVFTDRAGAPDVPFVTVVRARPPARPPERSQEPDHGPPPAHKPERPAPRLAPPKASPPPVHLPPPPPSKGRPELRRRKPGLSAR